MTKAELKQEVRAIANELEDQGVPAVPNMAMATWQYIQRERSDIVAHFRRYYSGTDPYQEIAAWFATGL